jgi:hypothetical protein
MTSPQITLQQDYQQIFGRAIKHIVKDPSLEPLIKSLKGNKENYIQKVKTHN